MTNVKIEPGKIEIEGHAGYAETGKDIVCAGVSALALGTLLAMEESGAFLQVEEKIKKGYMSICYKEEPGKEVICKNILKVFECGILLISSQYPDNVKINF